MKKLFTLFSLLSLLVTGIKVSAQTILWSENFNSGTSRYFTLNTADEGCALNPRSAWAINNAYTGTNGTVQGSVPCNLTGGSTAVGYNDENTPNEPAGITGYPNSYYMHIIDTSEAQIGVYCASWIIADNICVQAQNCFARMDTDINTTGLDSVTFKFWWMCYGNNKDVGKVYYSTNGGTSWTQITTPISNYNLTSTWVQQSIYLPAFDNQAQLRFGFMFVSTTGGGTQKDPPFCIDDIDIEIPSTPSNTITTGSLSGSPFCACSNVSVPFTSTGTFNASNTYIAQLSNASGSFASPVALDSITNDSSHSGTISATIPCNTATGAGYRIRIVSSNPATTGTDNGTNITINAQVTASVSITASPGNIICAGNQVTFTAKATNGGATPVYQWKVNGTNAGTNNTSFISSTLNNGDVVTCVMTSNAACVLGSPATSNTITMTVNTNPTVTAVASPGSICAGNSSTLSASGATYYSWSPSVNLNSGTGDTVIANPTNSATYLTTTYTVTGSTAAGCTNAKTVVVTVNPVPVLETNPRLVCSGSTITLSVTGADSLYTWSPATFLSASTGSSVNVTPTVTTTYTITGTNTYGCTGSATALITIEQPGAITVPPASICSGSGTKAALKASSGTSYTYNWLPGTGLSATTGASVNANPTITSTYTVVGTTTDGLSCTNSATVVVMVNTSLPPSVTLSANPGDTICATTPVTFTANPVNGGTTPSYQWKLNGIVTGSTSNTYSNSSLANGDVITCIMTSNATCVTTPTATSSVTMTVSPPVTPVVTISANTGNSICIGASVTFTATPFDGGTPSYQWKLNGNVTGTTSNSYSNSSLANGDVVSCTMTSSATCVTRTTADTSITMTVSSSLVPSVTLSANPGSSVCAGTPVSITANAVNGGTTPSYQWKLNGVVSGTTSGTYSNSSFSNGDVISCIMTSNATCVTTTTANSSLTMMVTANVTPVVILIANPDDIICTGTPVTITANPGNGGTTPSYQWKLNGALTDSISTTYSSSSFDNGDVVTCIMTSNATCVTAPTATSSVTMTVSSPVTPTVTISANTGNSICTGTPVTFTATPFDGGTPSYQWKLNGNVVGTTSNSYSTGSLANGDVVSCTMTSSATCVTRTTADTSITMTVSSSLVPSVTLSANPGSNVCAGTPVSITANAVNGGTAPSYQWKLNNNITGTTSNSYSNSSFTNGDVISCIMTSNATCVTTTTADTSITMTVSPNVTPAVTITSSTGDTICTGTPVTFSANPDNGGTAPSYQWKLNGSLTDSISTTYSSSTLANGDMVNCIMTSNAACATSPSDSASLTITVSSNLIPSVSISANPGNNICEGTPVTFNASSANGGSAPVYQWKLNGNNVGANTNSYSNNSLSNNDSITCLMTSSLSCVTSGTVTSTAITMLVSAAVHAGTIQAQKDTLCIGNAAHLLLNNNSGGNLQWQSSSSSSDFSNIAGATGNTYVSNALSQATYFRVYASNGVCSDTSPSIKIETVSSPTSTFTYSVSGQQVTFNVSAGNATSYYWIFGDKDTSNEENPVHKFDSVKIYHVCLTETNSANCTFTLCQNVETYPTGINNLNNEANWLVYPDPFGNLLYIGTGQTAVIAESVELYDVLGRRVFYQSVNGIMENPLQLDLTYLKDGVYYLRINTKEGDFIKSVIRQQ